jgi:hypothetical protein
MSENQRFERPRASQEPIGAAPLDRDSAAPLFGEALSSRKEIEATLLARINQYDGDANGFLSRIEIGQAFSDKEHRMHFDGEYEALSIAQNYLPEIQILSDDEWGTENDGITKNDLKALADLGRDADLAKQVDAALSAYSSLEPVDLSTPDHLRSHLEHGNPIPLVIGMRYLHSHDLRLGLLREINNSSSLDKNARVPNLNAQSLMLKDADLVELKVESVPESYWNGPELMYRETYDPVEGLRKGQHWRMVLPE